MKKIFYLSACVALTALLASCNGNKNTAQVSNAAEEYTRTLQNGNYQQLVNMMVFDEDSPRDIDLNEREAYLWILQDKIDPIMRQKGGIRDIRVKSSNIMNDGRKGHAVVETVYHNGQKEDMELDLVRVGDRWRINMDKHRQVWNTRTADGRHVSFTVKDYDNKRVFKQNIDGEREFIKVKEGDDREIVKVKDGDDRVVEKVIDKEDEIKIKEKENGEKTVTTIPKE